MVMTIFKLYLMNFNNNYFSYKNFNYNTISINKRLNYVERSYKPKKILPAHFHREYKREATRTCESVYVVEGKIRCNLYTKSGNFIDSFILKKNEMAIQLYGVHEYEIIEKSIVIENKNGPYFGPEIDRKRINVKKN